MIDFILVDTNFTTGFNIGGKFCVMSHDPREKASQVFNGFFTPVKENLGSFGPKSSWNTENQYYL